MYTQQLNIPWNLVLRHDLHQLICDVLLVANANAEATYDNLDVQSVLKESWGVATFAVSFLGAPRRRVLLLLGIAIKHFQSPADPILSAVENVVDHFAVGEIRFWWSL